MKKIDAIKLYLGIRYPKLSQLTVNLFFNYISLFTLAISGLLINIIIATNYGVATLGRFNIAFAFYIIFSQFSTIGLNYSVLYHLARVDNDKEEQCCIIYSAIVSGVLLSLPIVALLFISHEVISHIFKSNLVGLSILWIAPAILFFSINKILMGALNGLNEMKTYAIFQGSRYILMVSFVCYISIFDINELYLNANYLFSEFILMISLIYVLFGRNKLVFFKIRYKWIINHLKFGAKGFATGILVELNSRVDVLILGLFAPKTIVGIYSFAALFAEGLYQFTVILKNNVNPLLARYINDKSIENVILLIKKTRSTNFILISILVIIMLALYPLFIKLLSLETLLLNPGWLILLILSIGVMISSVILPYDNILIQANMPGLQSAYGASVVILNIMLNFVFIYHFGYIGCAIATVIATYISPFVMLSYLTNKYLQINLLTLRQ